MCNPLSPLLNSLPEPTPTSLSSLLSSLHHILQYSSAELHFVPQISLSLSPSLTSPCYSLFQKDSFLCLQLYSFFGLLLRLQVCLNFISLECFLTLPPALSLGEWSLLRLYLITPEEPCHTPDHTVHAVSRGHYSIRSIRPKPHMSRSLLNPS